MVKTIPLASIGPNEVVLREPMDIAEGNADVVMIIDGVEFHWPVQLPHGAVPFAPEVCIVSRGGMARYGHATGSC